MNDLGNRAKIKASLADLRAELKQLRLEVVNSSQDQSALQRSGTPLENEEARPSKEEELLVTATTPLEHLQRLLARGDG